MSRNVADHLSQRSLQLFDYQGEDVSVGIWLHESSIANTVQWISNPNMRGDGNCLSPNAIVVGHDLSPSQIRLCWDKHRNTGIKPDTEETPGLCLSSNSSVTRHIDK